MKKPQSSVSAKALRTTAVVVGALAVATLAGSVQADVAAPPAPAPTVRLISQSQYVSTINHIFGPDIAVKVRFAPVKRDDGLLGLGATSAVLTSGGLDPLETTGRAVADQIVDANHRAFLIPCKPADATQRDDQCARAFFTKIGKLIYRRPLTQDEIAETVNIAGSAVGKAGDFYAGLAYALSGMLVSPEFLFVRETAVPDSSAPGAYTIDGYSRASRLSFLLWDSAPDEELLTAAGKGDLNSPAGLRKQVDRMIASPLYKDGIRAFFNDFYVLEDFDTLSKDTATYPGMTLKAITEAREQLLRTVVDLLVTQHGDYRDLYTTRHTFISSDLGVLYRLPINLGSQGWIPYDFPADDPRAGILTQIGFLAQYSQAQRSSSTRRGRAIRQVVMCQKVPDPPPGVDFTKFEAPSNPLPTAKARLEQHREDPVCAGCHRLTDPIGVSFENFDGAGQYRAAERGTTIDPSGTLDGKPFPDAAGLGKVLRDMPATKSCVVDRLYAYSTGHKVTADQKPLLAEYEATLDKKGYRFDDMLRLIVLDKSYFSVRPPQVAEAAPVKTAAVGDINAH